MDVNDLLLLHVPYCVFTKMIECLDYALIEHHDLVLQWINTNKCSISSGSSLYHSLAKQNLTCYDLMKSFESLGDCDLTKRFKICMKGILNLPNGQCLLSQNIALQQQLDEANLKMRLQAQQVEVDSYRHHPMMMQRSGHNPVYRRPSPIEVREDNPDEVEFG